MPNIARKIRERLGRIEGAIEPLKGTPTYDRIRDSLNDLRGLVRGVDTLEAENRNLSRDSNR